MTDITIPPAAWKAAQAAFLDKAYNTNEAAWTAACLAMLRNWPGITSKQSNEHVALFHSDPALILPLPKEPSDDK